MYLYVRRNRLTDLGTGLEWVEGPALAWSICLAPGS